MIRLVRKLGIDKAIAYTILGRVVQAFGGVGVIFFIARYLSKVEQGFYYTFGSIIAIQIFFELGLNSIITQYVAHEMAHLTWDEDGINTSGNIEHQSRLSSLLHFVIKWFGLISVVLLVVLLIAGYYFFSHYNPHDAVAWRIPWAILSVSTCGFLVLDPLFAFLEGLGKVKQVAQMRLWQQVAYIATVVVLLFFGFGLYASALAVFVSFVTMLTVFLLSPNRIILWHFWKLLGQWKISYYKEIFPYQWKIALSWISGYFIFQLFNPVLFATKGAVVAGQMGMTVNGLNGVMALSMSWISTKVPLFSGLIAKKEFPELDKVFFKSLKQTLFVTFVGLSGVFVLVFGLQQMDFPLGNRFLPLLPLGIMCITFLFNCSVFAMAIYLRSHKEEPLLVQSIVFAILSAMSTIILGARYGVIGVTSGYMILSMTVSLPWVTAIFIKKRKLWH